MNDKHWKTDQVGSVVNQLKEVEGKFEEIRLTEGIDSQERMLRVNEVMAEHFRILDSKEYALWCNYKSVVDALYLVYQSHKALMIQHFGV